MTWCAAYPIYIASERNGLRFLARYDGSICNSTDRKANKGEKESRNLNFSGWTYLEISVLIRNDLFLGWEVGRMEGLCFEIMGWADQD